MATTPTLNSCFYFVYLTSYEINNQLAEFDKKKKRGMILNELKHLRRSKDLNQHARLLGLVYMEVGDPR